MTPPSFELAKFTGYRSCPGQYEDSYIRSANAVKIAETGSLVTVAVAESRRDTTAVFLEGFHAPKNAEFIFVSDNEFMEFIGGVVESSSGAFRGNDEGAPDSADAGFSLAAISSSSPVVNIINAVCLEAMRRDASDIHIEPLEEQMRIRYRIDGVLQTVKTLSRQLFSSIASRIKIMSNLNIMEQRQPQDGRMRVSLAGRSYDFRVSVVPVAYGESLVLRFFNTQGSLITLKDLGFSALMLPLLTGALRLSNGLVIATGPTGSGKTTTLHSLLHEMNTEKVNIITIEDPVERILAGINQIQVNYEIDLTFENLLRRVLRQDPDIIMVGEIRDTETAELALRAALTGHILLSTLHTNDSVSAISRLQNMGIEPYLIGSVLRFVIAQRLVRKVCPFCRKAVPAPEKFAGLQRLQNIAASEIYEETGCERCAFTGFSGRTVIGEILVIDPEVENMISGRRGAGEISAYAASRGMKTMREDAVLKVTEGVTTYSEIVREALV